SNHEATPPFGAYVLDACGGDVVALSDREFPLVVGDTTFVCDPTDGSIRRFDLDSAQAGEVLATGYDCAPRRRQGDTLLLRNWDENAYGLLRPDGVELLDYELDPVERESNTFPHAPYLGRWDAVGSFRENEQHRIMVWLGFKLIDLENAEVFEVPEATVAGFGMQDGEDILLVLAPNEAGESASLIIDELGDVPSPGPTFTGPVDFFLSRDFDGGVVTDTEVFLAESRESLSLPGPVPASSDLVRLDETRFASVLRDELGSLELAVWDSDSDDGWRSIELPPGGLCGGGTSFNEEASAFEGSFSTDGRCLDREYWSLPFDGTPGTFVTDSDSNQSLGHLGLGNKALLRAPVGWGKRDLEVIDIETGVPSTLASDIDGVASPPTPALPRKSPGEDGTIEYYVRSGEQAGLWITGVPTDI
ncbi:MAG: hypothetical protein KUG77_00935, partial [Nannocystaceae bacterium]|nr:hypothetical protein [Nannocystaceae bacterium]